MATPLYETDVCVIGGGVMGSFTALSLAERGLRVVLVDRKYSGFASGANPGTLGIQNKLLDALPLVEESLRCWRQMDERLRVETDYEQRGGFRVAETDDDVQKLEAAVAAQKAAGVDTEVVYRPRLDRMAAYLGPSVQAASFCPNDGMADALKTARGLALRLDALGVQSRSGCSARRILPRDEHDFIVETDIGPVKASWVVCAAGAWTAGLLAPLGIELPLSVDIMMASITDQAPEIFPHVITHVRGHHNWHLTLKQQRGAGKVLIGGGWKGEGDFRRGVHEIHVDRLKMNLALAVRVIPHLARLQVIRSWTGFEGRSPDKLLVIGPLESPRGIFVLCTAAGGFTISPFAGELAARWIADGDPAFPVDRYHVSRMVSQRAGVA